MPDRREAEAINRGQYGFSPVNMAFVPAKYKKGTGNDKQRKDAGNRTLCPYRNFSQAINNETDGADSAANDENTDFMYKCSDTETDRH